MTDLTVDKHHVMHQAVADLAQARALQEQTKRLYADLEAQIDALVEERFGTDKAQLSKALTAIRKSVIQAEDNVRDLAVQLYGKTQDKHPHPAVGIRVKTEYTYDPDNAVTYCVETGLTGALSLKRREFEKVASVTKPDFVIVSEVATATVKTDLSPWLEEQTDD